MKKIFCQLIFACFGLFACKEPSLNEKLSLAKLAVFCLHDIDGKGKYSLSLSQFYELLELLKGYEVLSLQGWYEKFKKQDVPLKAVVLTFDDGYPSVTKTVIPLLENYGYGATFYIYLNRYKENSPFYQELAQLKTNFEIGSHSLSHKKLIFQDKEKFYQEIYHSRLMLSYLTKKNVVSFAWPYGAYDRSFLDLPKLAGYETQVSTENRIAYPKDFLSIIPRFTLSQPNPLNQAKEVLKLLE